MLIVLAAIGCALVDADCSQTAVANVSPSSAAVTELKFADSLETQLLNVPPRYMWGWGPNVTGYCGATSLQSAALYFGLWVSVEHLRNYADNNVSQVLLGNGDFQNIAAEVGIVLEEWPYATTPQPQVAAFLNWALDHLTVGRPVITGVYEQKLNGARDYDHIVPVIGAVIGSIPNSQLPRSSIVSNVTTLYYNDLYSAVTRTLQGSKLGASRSQFTTLSPPVQPYDYALPAATNFGVAVLGLADPLNETYRLKLTAWSWTEPDWGSEDGCGMSPQPLDLSAQVYGLTPGNSYAVLRFDGNVTANKIPTESFLLAADVAVKQWNFVATGPTKSFFLFDRVWTNTTATYRAVLTKVSTACARTGGACEMAVASM
jgi:hypothetical protein